MFAVHAPGDAPERISCEYDTVVAVVPTVVGTLTMLYTVAPCCTVIAQITLPLPADVCRTKLNFAVEPLANDVDATPALLYAAAVPLSVDWLKVNIAPGVTVKLAVAALPLESMACTATVPVSPAGICAYAMNCPPVSAVRAGDVVTTLPPIRTIADEPARNPLPMICTVVDAGPVAGVRVIVGVASVSVEVPVLPAVSVTTTVLVAVAVTGTVNVTAAGNAPPTVVVAGTVIELYTSAPLNVTLKLSAFPNPVPVTVTVDPLSPVVGDKVVLPAIVICVVALLPFPSLTVNVYTPPRVLAGTMNHVVRL